MGNQSVRHAAGFGPEMVKKIWDDRLISFRDSRLPFGQITSVYDPFTEKWLRKPEIGLTDELFPFGTFRLGKQDYRFGLSVSFREIQIERQEKWCIFDFPNGHCQNVLLIVEKFVSSYRSRDPLSHGGIPSFLPDVCLQSLVLWWPAEPTTSVGAKLPNIKK